MRVTSLVLTACVVLGPAGCQVWSNTQLASTDTRIQGDPELVRLTLDNGTLVTLRNPRIYKDSINGLITEGPTKDNRIAFPVSQVRQLDRQQVSAGRTAALLVGIGAAGAVVFLAFVFNALSDPNY